MWVDVAFGVLGGVMIGAAAALLMWLDGRILGASGIAAGLLHGGQEQRWRAWFIAGMLCGGVLLAVAAPATLTPLSGRSPLVMALAGLMVGFGARLGSGCTSGHGVCGLSRLSSRSLAAVSTFLVCGMLTVFVMRQLGGG